MENKLMYYEQLGTEVGRFNCDVSIATIFFQYRKIFLIASGLHQQLSYIFIYDGHQS